MIATIVDIYTGQAHFLEGEISMFTEGLWAYDWMRDKKLSLEINPFEARRFVVVDATQTEKDYGEEIPCIMDLNANYRSAVVTRALEIWRTKQEIGIPMDQSMPWCVINTALRNLDRNLDKSCMQKLAERFKTCANSNFGLKLLKKWLKRNLF